MFVVLEHPYILYLDLLAKSPFLIKGFYFIRFYQIKNADVTIGGCSLAEEPFGMYVILGSICGGGRKGADVLPCHHKCLVPVCLS